MFLDYFAFWLLNFLLIVSFIGIISRIQKFSDGRFFEKYFMWSEDYRYNYLTYIALGVILPTIVFLSIIVFLGWIVLLFVGALSIFQIIRTLYIKKESINLIFVVLSPPNEDIT